MIRLLPWKWALALMALLFLIPGALLVRLQINNSPEIYLPESAPSVQLQNELRQSFPDWQVLVFLFEPPEVFDAQFLHRFELLAQEMLRDERVDRINRLTKFEKIERTVDGFQVRELIDVEKEQPAAAWRQETMADPFAPGFVVGREGQALAMIIRPVRMPDSPARLQFVQDMRSLVEKHQLEQALTGTAGQIAVDVEQFRSMLRDNLRFVPATVITGLMLIWWLFRRWVAMLAVAAVMSTAAQAALAVLVIAGQPFTLVAAILPPFMSAISLAFMVHFFGRLQWLSRTALNPEQRVRAAAEHVFKPSLFAALTTAGGLASLAVSTIQPVEWFGIAGAVATLVLFITVNYLMPPVLARFDHKPWPKEPPNTVALKVMTIRVAKFACRHALAITLSTIVIIALCVPLVMKVKTETNIYHFFEDDHPINEVTHKVEERLSGVMPLDVIFTAPNRDDLKEPASLQYIADFQAFAASQPEVNYHLSMVDILKEMHWAFQETETEQRSVPDNRQLIAQYMLIYDGKDIYDLVNRDFNVARLSLALTTHSTSDIRAVMQRFEQWLTEHPNPNLSVEFASEARLFTDQERLLVQGQVDGLYASLGMIFIFFVLMWRSIPISIMAMLPNMAPIFFVFAIMGATGIPLDMATALIAGVALGVAVDDTIHFVQNYREQLAQGRHHPSAILHCMAESGKACTINTLIISTQFLLLLSSDFVPTRYFGLMTAIGLLAAAVFDLLLLPALLTLMSRNRVTRRLLIGSAA